MKKRIILISLAAVLCSVIVSSVFTSCKKNDENKYDYTIEARAGGLLTGDAAVLWCNTVKDIYKTELGVDDDNFTKHGTGEECDQEVLNACKRAETVVITRVGGAGEIMVHNTTMRNTVYRRTIQ